MKNLLFLDSLPHPVVVSSIEGENLDPFDNCDGFASSANFANGVALDDEQLDTLTDSPEGSMLLFEMACDV